MANAAYSIAPRNDGANAGHEADATSMCNVDDRLDAARAILGISPSSVADSTVDMVHSFGGRFNKPLSSSYARSEPTSCLNEQVTGGTASACATLSSTRRPRSNSAGLDALAFLATREQEANEALSSGIATTEINRRVVIAPILSHGDNMNIAPKVISSKPHVASAVSSSSCSSDDDSETMPPPPPRIATMNYRRRSVSNPEGMEKWAPMDSMRRFHLVLPASILEEELAEATAAMRAKEETIGIPECNEDPLTSSCESDVPTSETDREKEDTDHDLPHDELLRRARSRLLEDLSEGNLNGEKGVLTLPHSLSKYKEVYNRNGRIGIYTPAERAAIIARFQGKRSRRVWNKKIRYNCRKNLADRRLRVKGRFVKRAPGQQDQSTIEIDGNTEALQASTFPSISEGSEMNGSKMPDEDADMPDVSDPDAGFCPTDDQPYRRLRRHTIT